MGDRDKRCEIRDGNRRGEMGARDRRLEMVDGRWEMGKGRRKM